MPERIIQQRITVKPGGQLVTYLRQKKNLKGENYMRIFSDTFCEVAIDKELTGIDLRVLTLILCGMEFKNRYSQPQKAIAQALGTTQSHIAVSIKKLIEKRLIQVIDQIGRQNIYMINPDLAFKDYSDNLEDLREEWINLLNA